jgi:hypothetical protein
MNLPFKWIALVLAAGLIGLALSVVFVAGARAQSPASIVQAAVSQPALPAGNTGPWGYSYRNNAGSTGTLTPTWPAPYAYGGYGPGMMGGGMMGGRGYGGRGMMGSGMGPGMMGGYGAWGNPGAGSAQPPVGTPRTLDQAADAVRQYVATYGNPDLALVEVMEFSDNFYAEVKEQSTGIHAFEVLIDRYTGSVYPEPGPNMMWNTRYGPMGDWQGGPAGTMPVTPEQARASAQQWLDRYLPGMTAADEADAFYGYYTIHVMNDGRIYGMLSVNGYTGAVWYHTWHGTFVDMQEMEQ